MKRVYSLGDIFKIRKYWDSIVLYMDDEVREYTNNNSDQEYVVSWLNDYLDNAYKMAPMHYKEFLNVLAGEFGVDLI